MCSDENTQRVDCDTRRRESASSSPPRVEMVCLHFFSSWNFPNSQSPEARRERISRRDSLITDPKLGKLFSWDHARLSRAAKRFINAKICFGVLRFTTRWVYSNEKSEWLDSFRCFGLNKKCVLRERPPRENEPRRSMIHRTALATCEPSLAARLHRSVMTASLGLTLTLNWRHSPCCTGTGARKLSTPSCPNFFRSSCFVAGCGWAH